MRSRTSTPPERTRRDGCGFGRGRAVVEVNPRLSAIVGDAQAKFALTATHLRARTEALPFADQSFDVVLSTFGAMFSPDHNRVAAEMARVCRPGGRIGLANWTPEGFVGKSFRVTADMVPPPAGIPAPVLWGTEEAVRKRFSRGISKLSVTREKVVFHYPFSPRDVVEFFRQYFGPTQVTFSRLDTPVQAELSSQLESLWAEHNTASDGSTRVEAEYLDVRAIRG